MSFHERIMPVSSKFKEWLQNTFAQKNHTHTGIFDSRPDFARAVEIDKYSKTGTGIPIFVIDGDGWLFYRGTVNSDQDIYLVGTSTVEAITSSPEPHQYDRIFYAGSPGNQQDECAGMVYVSADHPLYFYAAGNDPNNWRISFVPSKDTPDNVLRFVDDGPTTTTRYIYPAHADVKQSIRKKNGNVLVRSRNFVNLINTVSQFSALRPNNPFALSRYSAVEQRSLSKIFHRMHDTTNQNFNFVRYSTENRTVTDPSTGKNVTKLCKLYWFSGNSKNYSTTGPNWNEQRYKRGPVAGDETWQFNTEVLAIDQLILENVDNKWRAIIQYNWLDRAAVSNDKSYSSCGATYNKNSTGNKTYGMFVGTKHCIAENRPVTTADVGWWRRYSDSVMWRIDSVTPNSSGTGVDYTYTPYTCSGSATVKMTMTQGEAKTVTKQTGNVILYKYDAVNNPHPYTWQFNNRWTFQSRDVSFEHTDTFVKRVFTWGFKHSFTAISPVVTFEDNEVNPRNPNKILAPSKFYGNLNFSGNWTLYYVYGNYDSSYLNNTHFPVDKSTIGWRAPTTSASYPHRIKITTPITLEYGNHLTKIIGDINESENDSDTSAGD